MGGGLSGRAVVERIINPPPPQRLGLFTMQELAQERLSSIVMQKLAPTYK